MKNYYLFSQPHQPFFVLAFINAIISMFIFMLLFKGLAPSEILSVNYHTYSFIFLMFTPAFLAFLFTTFPRFSASDPINKSHYMHVFWLFLAGSVLFQIAIFTSVILLILSVIVTFIAHLGAVRILVEIYKKSTVSEKSDQKWILIAMLAGVASHIIFIISIWIPSLHQFAIQVAIYLYLFLLIFTIAQRMVPFFSHSPIEKHTERFQVIVGLLALHILLESIQAHSSFLTDTLLAYLIGKELYRWKLPFPNQDPLVWILHISLFWVPVAFALSAITNLITLSSGTNFLSLGIHILTLGFFVTILIGFGTRVTLGHSSNSMYADRLTVILFYWTQVVVLVRILTSFAVATNWNFVVLFDLSITVWIVLFSLWGSRFFSVLIFGKKLKNK